MKRCKKCGVEKDQSEFYADPRMKDGLLSECKACKNAYSQNRRYANLEYAQKYDRYRKRASTLKSRGDSVYDEFCKAKSVIAKRRKDKNNVNLQLNRSVISGATPKPGWCCMCGSTSGKISGHHFDYSLPLSVIWCCDKCHGILHRKRYTGKEWSNG